MKQPSTPTVHACSVAHGFSKRFSDAAGPPIPGKMGWMPVGTATRVSTRPAHLDPPSKGCVSSAGRPLFGGERALSRAQPASAQVCGACAF